jgi:hypothetical protein
MTQAHDIVQITAHSVLSFVCPAARPLEIEARDQLFASVSVLLPGRTLSGEDLQELSAEREVAEFELPEKHLLESIDQRRPPQWWYEVEESSY